MIFLKNYYVATTKEIDVISIHSEVKYALHDSKAKKGLLTITLPESGGGVVVLDSYPDRVAELKKSLSLNSPLQREFLGVSLSLPFEEENLKIGPRRNLYIIDFSDTAKRREFWIQIFAEEEPKRGGTAKPQRR